MHCLNDKKKKWFVNLKNMNNNLSFEQHKYIFVLYEWYIYQCVDTSSITYQTLKYMITMCILHEYWNATVYKLLLIAIELTVPLFAQM